MTTQAATGRQPLFSRYQVFIIAVLAIIQFTVILDFMVISPPAKFRGTDLIVAAGFADK